MSTTNEKPAIHAADCLAGDVLNEVSNQAEASKARSDERDHEKTSNGVMILGVSLVALAIVFLFGLADPGPPLSTAELRYSMLDEMSELVYDIEDYRDEYGVIPDVLTLLGKWKNPALSYQIVDQNHYRVSFRDSGHALVYKSDDLAAEFFTEARGIE